MANHGDPAEFIRRLQTAVLEHDGATLELMVAGGFALTGSGALGLLDRRRWLQSALDFNWESFEFEETRTIDLGPTAVVVSRVRQHGTWDGRDISGRFLLVDVCRTHEGGWWLVSRYAERLRD